MRSGRYGARARTWSATTTASLLLASSAAHAGAPAFDLDWSAPAECPSGEEIAEATRARLGARPAGDAPVLFVRGSVTPEPGGFLVELVIEDDAGRLFGRRQVLVEGASCNAVADATALVLAMIIAARPDGSAPVPTTVEEAAPPPAVVVPIAPEPQPPALARSPHEEAATSRRVMLGAAAVASRGVLPTAGVGVALRTSYSPVPLALLAIEASFEEGSAVRDDSAEVGFAFAGGSALAGLRILRTDAMELVVTLSGRAGVVRTSGTGFHAKQSGARAIALVGAGLLLRAKLSSSLYLEALPLAEAVLVRDRFHLRDGEATYPIHRPALLAGRLSLGIAYEFP